MKLLRVVKPDYEPISLADMKGFLRVLHSEDDILIDSYIGAAREKLENITNTQVLEATFELYFDVMPETIILHRPPFVELVSFQVYDGTTWNDVVDYELDDKSTPATLHPIKWGTVATTKNSVKVIYKAGYSSDLEVPKSMIAWMNIEVEKMYDEEKPKIDVDSLLDSFRIRPL